MPSGTPWESKGRDIRTANDADQAEINAVAFGSSNLEAGIADERIAGAMDDYEVSDPLKVADWAEVDAQYDSGTSAVGDEVLRRKKLMGDLYPFELMGNRIVHTKSRSLVYEFCLAVSQAPNLTTGEFVRLPRAFERLARDVAQRYLGVGALGYRTGWPGDRFEERPVKFRAVVNKLAELCGEWRWSPLYGRPEDPDHQYLADCGVDFVVWKPLPDKRSGQLFILGQCACGDDWTSKFGDLSIDRLMEWIRPISDAAPMRSFFVPHHIANAAHFSEVNMKAGLSFDRARIAMISDSEENRDVILSQMKDPYESLIKLVIPQFN